MTCTAKNVDPPREGASRPGFPVQPALPELERQRLANLLERLGQQAITAALGSAPTAGEREGGGTEALPQEEDDAVATNRMLLRMGANGF